MNSLTSPHGALRSNNLFMFDGVNTTDPTAGTVGDSLNFEAIQEVLVRTSAVSAEFGPATGAIVDVITKSGTNRPQGSFKYLLANDAWNAPNTTHGEVAAADGSFPSLARTRFDRQIRYYTYLQWIADEQWHRARMEAAPVAVFGDFPFMVSGHSADVWARQHEFDLEASVGTPPDAFSATGQDWGLPAYRWEVCDAGGYEWLRQRARRSADLYDGFRIDHLIGFFRTYVRKPGVDPRVAAPAVLAALAGIEPARVAQLLGAAHGDLAGEAMFRGVPPQFLSPSTGRSFVVRAEVRTPTGGSFAQEAVIELAASEMPDELREWRRGQSRFGTRLRDAIGAGVRSGCTLMGCLSCS